MTGDAIRRRTIFFLLWTVLLAGCEAAKPPPALSSGKPISDLSLTLSLRDATGAEEYYTLARDGTFGFGGGLDARFQRVTWTTQLTADEMQRLREQITQQGWFDQGLSATNQPPDARYQIDAHCGKQSLRKTIKGVNDHIEPVRLVLRDIANRRLHMDLERQPKPSLQQRTVPGTGPASQPATQP